MHTLPAPYRQRAPLPPRRRHALRRVIAALLAIMAVALVLLSVLWLGRCVRTATRARHRSGRVSSTAPWRGARRRATRDRRQRRSLPARRPRTGVGWSIRRLPWSRPSSGPGLTEVERGGGDIPPRDSGRTRLHLGDKARSRRRLIHTERLAIAVTGPSRVTDLTYLTQTPKGGNCRCTD
jgi:hypothetical protein